MTGLIGRGFTRLRQMFSFGQKDAGPGGLVVNPVVTQAFLTQPTLLAQLLGGGITQPYANHSWVYACVGHIAQSIAAVPMLFFTGTRADKQLVDNHPLINLFDNPNPFMSGQQLIEATMIFMGLAGEAFWVLERKNAREIPAEIWTFNPDRFTEVVDQKTGMITGWVYQKRTARVPLENFEVIHFRYFNPYDDYRGLSPLSAAKSGIDQDFYAGQYNTAFFQNSAVPGGIITIKNGLNDEQFQRLKNQWNDRHGGSSRAHRIGILEGDATYTTTGISQKDMDFLQGRKFNREEILAAFKVPRTELGILEQVQFAWAKQAEKQFWKNCLLPKMAIIESSLSSQLHSQLPAPIVWTEFDRHSISSLQEDLTELDNRAKLYWSMGLPFNVINETLGLGFPEIDGGEVGYIPMTLTPISEAGKGNGQRTGGPSLAAGLDGPALPPLELPSHSLSAPLMLPEVMIRTKPDRHKFWKQYHDLQVRFERKFQPKMKRYFYGQRKEVLRRIDQYWKKSIRRASGDEVDNLMFDMEAWNKNLQKLCWAHWIDTGEEAGKSLVAELGADPKDFILVDTPAIDVLKEKQIKVVGINEVTRENLRSTLIEGMDNLETAAELQQRVRDVFNFSESRSLTIARTETGQAAAPARDAAMDMLGVEQHEWTTAGDDAVRDIHAEMDGEVVDRGETFSNGLMYPCDPAGDAEETINCRCAAVPAAGKS